MMNHLQAQLQLELSQVLLQALIAAGIANLNLPIRVLRFWLGRLQGGSLTSCQISPQHWSLGIKFASGPALELSLQALEYQPEGQVWRLRVERLHFSGFSGARLLNLAPGRVLEGAVAQANRRLPGLLVAHKNLGLELHLPLLLQKVLEEAHLRQMFKERLGLEPTPELWVQALELLEGKLRLELGTRF